MGCVMLASSLTFLWQQNVCLCLLGGAGQVEGIDVILPHFQPWLAYLTWSFQYGVFFFFICLKTAPLPVHMRLARNSSLPQKMLLLFFLSLLTHAALFIWTFNLLYQFFASFFFPQHLKILRLSLCLVPCYLHLLLFNTLPFSFTFLI